MELTRPAKGPRRPCGAGAQMEVERMERRERKMLKESMGDMVVELWGLVVERVDWRWKLMLFWTGGGCVFEEEDGRWKMFEW
jgi:hypothetical protein